MDILMLQKEVLGRQGVLGRIYGQNRDLSLTDYAAGWNVASGGQVSDFGEFLSSVELLAASLAGKVFTGKLTWIGPAVDERTRMARARADRRQSRR